MPGALWLFNAAATSSILMFKISTYAWIKY